MKKLLILSLTIFLYGNGYSIKPDLPQLNEPKVFSSYEIPKKYKNTLSEKYDILSLNSYLNTIIQNNKKDGYYKTKIDNILTYIKNSKYNFDVYVDGYVRTGKSLSAKYGASSAYTERGVNFHIDKLLFDGDYFLKEKYEIINKNLSKMNILNSKNRLKILALSFYSELYFSQERLKTLKTILKNQEKIFKKIKNKFKKGKTDKITFLTAKNDLLSIKKDLLLETQKYVHNDYILRYTLNSHSQKPFLLQNFSLNSDFNSLLEIQKLLIKNNSEIKNEINLLKLKKIELLSQKNRYYPEVKFNSNIGYSETSDKTFNMSNLDKGTNWELALTFKIPFYNQNKINLNKEKTKYDILIQKTKISKIEKDKLVKAEKLFNSIKFLNKQIEIEKEQVKLAKEKMDILKQKFIVGVSSYEKFSRGVKQYLNYLKNLQQIEKQKSINIGILNILIGREIVE
jgi:hypothetical protein